MEVTMSPEHEQDPAFNTFTCFAKLPLELRLKIWALTIRRRLLIIKPYSGTSESGIRRLPYLFKARVTRQPALLHVNFESRQVALQHYKLAFKSTLSNGPVYFNYQLDALHLRGRLSMEVVWHALLHDEEAKARIQVLVFEDVPSSLLAREINEFPGVKEVFVHESTTWLHRSLEYRFRQSWDEVKGEGNRQLVVKFPSNAALEEMIKIGIPWKMPRCYFRRCLALDDNGLGGQATVE